MKKYYIFQIPFINEDFNSLIKQLKLGGLIVVPSGPGLATIGKDLRYTEAIQNSDIALFDSGYMVFLLKLLKGVNIKKFSGYDFMRKFLNQESINENDLFLIDPTEMEAQLNNEYLNDIGIFIDPSYHYVAPIYGDGEIIDKTLINILNDLKQKPKYIMINLGSNVQEPLGYYLKQNLNFKLGILCTGAAISFLTGAQAGISPTIDRLGLGWLWRCIKNPKVFIPRYFKAFYLFFLILKTEVKITE